MRNFRQLDCWQAAHRLAFDLHQTLYRKPVRYQHTLRDNLATQAQRIPALIARAWQGQNVSSVVEGLAAAEYATLRALNLTLILWDLERLSKRDLARLYLRARRVLLQTMDLASEVGATTKH